MPRFLAMWLAILLATTTASAADRLPGGPDHDEVVGLCDACHSLRIVDQQRLDRARWNETLDWMVEEQGMPALEPDEHAVILDYLVENFGRDVPR